MLLEYNILENEKNGSCWFALFRLWKLMNIQEGQYVPDQSQLNFLMHLYSVTIMYKLWSPSPAPQTYKLQLTGYYKKNVL